MSSSAGLAASAAHALRELTRRGRAGSATNASLASILQLGSCRLLGSRPTGSPTPRSERACSSARGPWRTTSERRSRNSGSRFASSSHLPWVARPTGRQSRTEAGWLPGPPPRSAPPHGSAASRLGQRDGPLQSRSLLSARAEPTNVASRDLVAVDARRRGIMSPVG